MQVELEDAINRCRDAVDRFAHDPRLDELVCLETRSLHLLALAAYHMCNGVWTKDRSKAVEEIFRRALDVHESFAEDQAKLKYYRRLEERDKQLRKEGIYIRQITGQLGATRIQDGHT
ncbi:MAG: hypothetical protein ACYTKD_21105 [Planctomycetota bacterium]|jgi:hypothetical protein